MTQCIYCRQEKDESAFKGREHVMPQAFGLFRNNLVLRCVCDTCNNYFGRTIDEKLARDSMEGFDRVSHGMKPASEFKSLGSRSTSHVEFTEGMLKGAKGYAVASRNGEETLGLLAFPQIGIRTAPDVPYEIFPADAFPTKDELIASGYEVGQPIEIQTFEVPNPFELLRSKGYDLSTAEKRLGSPPEGRTRIENVTRIWHPEYRAATKIALNYVAAVLGSTIALRSEFDAARSYVLSGESCARVPVHVFENPWFLGRRGHYASLTRHEDLIVAQVSVLMRTQYIVTLASGATHLPFYATAHVFDLTDERLHEVDPLPIRPGRPLKRIPAPSSGGRSPPTPTGTST